MILLLLFITNIGYSQKLIIIEQDFDEAVKIAAKENKLLFIDFYTTWCTPCKELEKWVFQNDTISENLAGDFVLLRYDAEQDKKYHLSKKHHVNSYPTGIILNSDGFVINRKYGFPGENIEELNKSVFEFTDKSIELNKYNQTLKGYSNNIDITKYPKFYIDFINRDNIKVVLSSDFKEYWNESSNIFSEEYFSTLVYFAKDVPITIADSFLENKIKYIELYGETDVNVALLFMTFGKFEDAILNKSQEKYNNAVLFMKKALDKKSVNQMLPMFKKRFEDTKNE